jgi:dTDP-glucose 4,6-dehydratase
MSLDVDASGKFDHVWHLASLASPKFYLRILWKLSNRDPPHPQYARNRTPGWRSILVTSTSECYGDPLEHPQSETYWGNVNPVGLRSCYDESKRYAEALTMAFHRTHGVATNIARIFNTYVPGWRWMTGAWSRPSWSSSARRAANDFR